MSPSPTLVLHLRLRFPIHTRREGDGASRWGAGELHCHLTDYNTDLHTHWLIYAKADYTAGGKEVFCLRDYELWYLRLRIVHPPWQAQQKSKLSFNKVKLFILYQDFKIKISSTLEWLGHLMNLTDLCGVICRTKVRCNQNMRSRSLRISEALKGS